MLTHREELERLQLGMSDVRQMAPVMLEALSVEADCPSEVVERARRVMEIVVEGFEDGLSPRSSEWMQQLPGWLMRSFSPVKTEEERNAWLVKWRALDRAGKIAAEAEQGWTLVDWLAALGPDIRAWRWWSRDSRRVWVVVDGWPCPLDALVWLLGAAGATAIHQES